METIRFMTSLLTFYLKGEIRHEQNFIKLKRPNTILSLIPLGAKNDSLPINQIASVETNFKLLFKNLLVGLIVAVIGFSCLAKVFVLGLILALVGAAMIINAFQIELILQLTSGGVKYLQFLIFEKSKAELAAEKINALISDRLNDTNVRVHTEKQTDTLVDAIQNLKK